MADSSADNSAYLGDILNTNEQVASDGSVLAGLRQESQRLRSAFAMALALATLLMLALAGCALPRSEPTPLPPTPAPPTATPLPRGGNLTVVVSSDVEQLRPWAPASRSDEHLVGLVYRGLTRLDPTLVPQPDLAERWDVSPDGLMLTFTLRSDLVWHDGDALDAEDVVWTLRSLRELSPTTALIADLRRVVADVSSPITGSVVLSLTERYAPLLAELAVPVLPSHLLRSQPLDSFDFWRTPVGSGPFQLADRIPGESIVLSASPTYYRGEPLLSRIAFVVASDPKVSSRALADGVVLLGELPATTGRDLRVTGTTSEALQFGSYAENGYYYLAINSADGRLFSDLRLRQALALSVDLPALMRQVTEGTGITISTSAVPGSWADLTPFSATLDLARAGQLLDEAGWIVPEGGGTRLRDGIPLSAQIFVRGDDPRRVAAAQLIADSARQIGMDLQVQPADFQSVVLGLYSPPYNFDLLVGSWSNGAAHPDFADYVAYDPDDFALFHSSQVNQGEQDLRPALRNIVGLRDAAYDNQAQAGRQLYDREQRKEAYRQTQARIAELHPYLFLWADRIDVVANSQLTTLDGPLNLNTPFYFYNIERWYLQRP